MITRDVKDIDEKDMIDHFNLTITTKAADDDEEVRPQTATAEYVAKDEDDNEDVLRATVTNDGDENASSSIVSGTIPLYSSSRILDTSLILPAFTL